MQTANSNNINTTWIIKITLIYKLELIDLFPNKVISKWPAIILAVNRTANDPGRIRFLIVSIHTIKGVKILGVPKGTKWQNIWFILFNQPNSIKVNHKGKAKLNV